MIRLERKHLGLKDQDAVNNQTGTSTQTSKYCDFESFAHCTIKTTPEIRPRQQQLNVIGWCFSLTGTPTLMANTSYHGMSDKLCRLSGHHGNPWSS